jgi:microcystin degradation protein MlrC
MRIALLGIYHESNTFVASQTVLNDFKKGHFLKGEDIRKEYEKAHHEIGGMIEVIDEAGFELVPVMYAAATPGGTISSQAYRNLLDEMMDELGKILPVDGCLVVPHGAGVSESYPDMDGHWLSVLREKTGTRIPIVGTLDPHANVSQLMASSTVALVAYKTNPHIDQRRTGKQAAGILVNLLKGKVKPVQMLTEIPLAISIEQQHTGSEPCKSLYDLAEELSRQKDILSISIILGFPYADVSEMGTSVLVVSDNDPDLALKTGKELESFILKNRENFVGDRKDISYSFSLVSTANKPVLMLDMGDNVGGGSSGNSTVLLDALEQHGNLRSFICIYDPLAVSQASLYGIGAHFKVCIKNDQNETRSYNVSLIRIADGKFNETTPRHGGQVHYDMGKIAIVITGKGTVIMLTSERIAPFSLQQLTAFNIIPADFDVIVAKGVNAPIAAYSSVCPTVIQVNTPGETQADMTRFKYQNRRKPLYPFEEITAIT